MLWSLKRVVIATFRGARDSRVTLLIGLCWHQARPTSPKAAVAHFSPPGPAGPGVHKHFHPLRAGPPRAHDRSYGGLSLPACQAPRGEGSEVDVVERRDYQVGVCLG